MRQAIPTFEQLSRSFPEERESLRRYLERAKAYGNECGCSMGAAWLVGSLGLLIVYGVFFHGFGKGHLMAGAFWGTAFVFAASLAGKLTGIGLARIRLALLLRHLRIHYPVKGE